MAFQALNYANAPIPQGVLEAFADQPKLRDQIAAFIGMNSNIRTQRNEDMQLTTSATNSSESLQYPGVSEHWYIRSLLEAKFDLSPSRQQRCPSEQETKA
jgi:hypothetical protein